MDGFLKNFPQGPWGIAGEEDSEMQFKFTPGKVHKNLTVKWIYVYNNEIPLFLGRYTSDESGTKYQSLEEFRADPDKWRYCPSHSRYNAAAMLWREYEEKRST